MRVQHEGYHGVVLWWRFQRQPPQIDLPGLTTLYCVGENFVTQPEHVAELMAGTVAGLDRRLFVEGYPDIRIGIEAGVFFADRNCIRQYPPVSCTAAVQVLTNLGVHQPVDEPDAAM